MGSPGFALPSLESLAGSGRYTPILVVTQPDRQSGRGKRLQPTPVKVRALELGLPVEEMSREKYADVAAGIVALRPDIIVVVAFGIIIRSDLLNLPKYGCINVHASLLPKYRGVSPIQAAIQSGDSEMGCTPMLIDAGVDTGDMLLHESTPVLPDDNAGTLTDRLAGLGAALLVRTLDGLRDGSVKRVAQDDSRSSYVRKIKKIHGRIDWSRPAEMVDRHIRAMSPWPSAFTFHGGRRLIVEEAVVSAVPSDTAAGPGEVVSLDPFIVACARGALEILRLKPEGKKSMTPAAYLVGHALSAGDKLE